MIAPEHDVTFRAMGCDVRFLIGTAGRGPLRPIAGEVASREHSFVQGFAARLSRFDERSELCALNADPRSAVPASPLLRAAVGAGLWAARRTGGLVDPTLVTEIERAGYASSREGAAAAPLAQALREAPARTPARPHPDARWREVEVDDSAGAIVRPPGVRLDTGGTGKGLAADAIAHRLSGQSHRFAIDCGGDIAVGGPGALARPYEIAVEHPLTGDTIATISLPSGGVATSGIDRRVWRRSDGSYAHHLLDPSTGAPAWTGVISATAVAASALEAETLSKQALLLGPDAGRDLLAANGGGVLVHDGGEAELVAPNPRSLEEAA